MNLTRRLILLVLASFAFPLSGLAQIPYWLDVSPETVYLSPGSPNCYIITVGGGEYMTVDILYTYNGSSPQEVIGWPSLDGNGRAQVCADEMALGQYVFVGVRNTYEPWWGYIPTYSPLNILPAPQPPPAIYGLGAGCDNWDCLWIVGDRFLPDSRLFMVSPDWSLQQWYYGPAWGQLPAFGTTPEANFIAFQITDPAALNWFGNDGLWVLVVNNDGTTSNWTYVQSPRPVITSGGSGCDDQYCIWLTGGFPLNATVDLRVPGQPDIIADGVSGLSVTSSLITFQVNPSARYAFDTTGLEVWVVNPPLHNWSQPYDVPPVDRGIVGNIDSITPSGYPYSINGWACAKTYAGSIDVHVYAGGPAGGGGTFAFSGTANQSSEPAVAAACGLTGSHYRFSLPIPSAVAQVYRGQPIYVHGISPFGLANTLIGGSGSFFIPDVDRSVAGSISNIVVENGQYYLKGWACAKTFSGSITVYLYVGGPGGSGTYVTPATANQSRSDNSSIDQTCNSGGAYHGFSILLSLTMRQQFNSQTLYVYGISPFGLDNLLIGNSGNLNMPLPAATSSKEYIYLGDRLLAVDTTNLP